MHPVRASRSLARALRIGAAIALVVALCIATTSSAGSGDCLQVFLATFTGVSDGPGVGGLFPAEIGRITVSPLAGRIPGDNSSRINVVSERLVFNDVNAVSPTDFGVRMTPTVDALNGAVYSIVIREEQDCTAFGGDVSDGSTTDMLCFDVSGSSLTVNGNTLATRIRTGTSYRLDINLFPSESGADYWEIWVTNLDTGDGEYATDLIVGGYRPVHSLGLVKHGGKPGAFSADSISLVGIQH